MEVARARADVGRLQRRCRPRGANARRLFQLQHRAEISGGSDASIDAEAGDAADFDAAVSDAVNTPDGLDIVDVGVPTDIDALINP